MNLEEIINKLNKYHERKLEIESLLESPEISIDRKLTSRLSKELYSIVPYADIFQELKECQEEIELFKNDSRVLSQVENKVDGILSNLKRISSGKMVDEYEGAIVEIVSPTQTISNKLLDMYVSYCRKEGYSASIDGSIITISGLNIYAKLKREIGIHRFVDTKQDAKVFVYPLFNYNLTINDKDIRVDYYHSSGAGGQNVNKVETAIRITHIPTGIVVNCQDERSQKQNKDRAFEMLREKLGEKSLKDDKERLIKEKKTIQKSMKLVREYRLKNNSAYDAINNREYDVSQLFNGGFDIILNDVIV